MTEAELLHDRQVTRIERAADRLTWVAGLLVVVALILGIGGVFLSGQIGSASMRAEDALVNGCRLTLATSQVLEDGGPCLRDDNIVHRLKGLPIILRSGEQVSFCEVLRRQKLEHHECG